MSRLQIPIHSSKLENGLRVVIAPDAIAPVVTVGIYYKIGFRLEPAGSQRIRAPFRAHDVSRIGKCAEDAAHQADQFQWRLAKRIDDVRCDKLLRSGAVECGRAGFVAGSGPDGGR